MYLLGVWIENVLLGLCFVKVKTMDENSINLVDNKNQDI